MALSQVFGKPFPIFGTFIQVFGSSLHKCFVLCICKCFEGFQKLTLGKGKVNGQGLQKAMMSMYGISRLAIFPKGLCACQLGKTAMYDTKISSK
jgi:hypothetical protein